MKFFKELFLILSNQRGELDLGSESESSTETEDLSTEGLMASLDSMDVEEEAPATEASESETEEVAESGDLESQLEQLEGEESKDLLEQLNTLGIIHKGLPIEFDDVEKVKEALSKGFDYTQKTQELAEMRKEVEAELTESKQAFEQERESFEAEKEQHNEILTQHSILQKVLGKIQREDPDLFSELDGYYSEFETNYAPNPEVDTLKKELAEIKGQLSSTQKNEETEKMATVRKEWENGIKEVQSSLGPKLRTLGIRPDWKKVQEVWKSDDSGKMTVKSALFAAYGEEMQKALDNKNKLVETRAKVARTAGTPDNNDEGEKIFGMESGNPYEKEAFKILEELN